MDWKQLALQALAAIIRLILERRLDPALAQAAGPGTFGTPAERADVGRRLKQAIDAAKAARGQAQPANVAGQPAVVGADDGIIAHLERLYAAWEAGDWAAVVDCVKDFISHL